MLTPEQITFFRENGFLNYGPVLTESEVAALREALDRTLRGESEAKPDSTGNIGGGENSVVTQVVNIWEAEPAFRKHLSHPHLVTAVSQLMGADTVRVWHDQVQIKPPRIGGPTLWHQDHPYWPIIQPADLVSAWVALEDAVIENGCMSMVPRSHKWGNCHKDRSEIGTNRQTWGPDPDPSVVPEGETVETVVCEVPAGSVVFHHCLCWHGAPPNLTERNRPAIAVHYMPGWTRYEPSGVPHVVEQHVTVAPGEILTGKHFPTVLDGGRLVEAAAL